MPKTSLVSRVTRLEEAVEKHLMESGEIRTDLAWLKRAFWAFVAIFGTFVASFVVSVVLYGLGKR